MVGRLTLTMMLTLGCMDVSFGQSSLSVQQERCDSLRRDVERSRRQLDAQSRTSDAARNTDETVISAMRVKGRTEQEIEQYRRMSRMQRGWGGTEENARREHDAAIERYSMQGCSTGGVSTYNYNVE